MWKALMSSGIFCSLAIFICYWIFNESRLSYFIEPRKDDFRHLILKQEYEHTYYTGDGYFSSSMSDQQEQQYIEYIKRQRQKHQRKVKFIYALPMIIGLLLISCITALGAWGSNVTLKKEVAEYIAIKNTLEQSISNENLTGLEKIEIVKVAGEQNAWLAQKKVEVSQWHSFYLDKDIVLALEEIKL